jgi:uncharacterized membrane protein YfcA
MYNQKPGEPVAPPDTGELTLSEVFMSPYVIVGLFFLVALGYSSVGLGGGTSYIALLTIFGFSAAVIPLVSLTLNLLVTSVASYNFIRQRHASPGLIAPFLVTSIPMAYLGGALQIPKETFYWVLLLSLCLVAVRVYLWKDTAFHVRVSSIGKLVISLLAGAALGLVAGIVGIGGGIFLVPLIIVLGLGTGKQAAACGAIFIWLNSLAGLLPRLPDHAVDWPDYMPLFIAVIVGGGLGSFMGSARLSQNTMEKILGAIVIVAILSLLRKLLVV